MATGGWLGCYHQQLMPGSRAALAWPRASRKRYRSTQKPLRVCSGPQGLQLMRTFHKHRLENLLARVGLPGPTCLSRSDGAKTSLVCHKENLASSFHLSALWEGRYLARSMVYTVYKQSQHKHPILATLLPHMSLNSSPPHACRFRVRETREQNKEKVRKVNICLLMSQAICHWQGGIQI